MTVDRTAEEGLGGGHSDGEVAAARDDDRLGTVLAGELLPLRLAEHDRCTGLHNGELLCGDRLARRPEHVRMLERDVRQHLDG